MLNIRAWQNSTAGKMPDETSRCGTEQNADTVTSTTWTNTRHAKMGEL
jgi:hypothetical protein